MGFSADFIFLNRPPLYKFDSIPRNYLVESTTVQLYNVLSLTASQVLESERTYLILPTINIFSLNNVHLLFLFIVQ